MILFLLSSHFQVLIDCRTTFQRMKELQASEGSCTEKLLRLSVETGGCSGFQYVFDLDDKANSDDRYSLKVQERSLASYMVSPVLTKM